VRVLGLVFVLAGAWMTFQGIMVIYGCFVRTLSVQERAWWQRAYPPPVPTPFNYPVRVLYAGMGVIAIAIGVAFLFELFV
jgi:hypothetical protein